MSDKQYTHRADETHLESALRRTIPWFEANATFLIYGLAGALAVAAGIVWYQRQPEPNAEVSALLADASEPGQFQSIADKYGETSIGQWARLNQADRLLNSGFGKLFTDRKAAQADLDQAGAAFDRLAGTQGLDGTLMERVLIGQARLAEINCDGSEESVQSAVSAWQAVLDKFPGSVGEEMATHRIERLGLPESAQFYVWFHAHEPKPMDEAGSGHSLDGFGPSTDVPGIPSIPDFGDSNSSDAADETGASNDDSADESAENPGDAELPLEAGDSETGDADAVDTDTGDEQPAADTDSEDVGATTDGEPTADEPAVDESSEGGNESSAGE